MMCLACPAIAKELPDDCQMVARNGRRFQLDAEGTAADQPTKLARTVAREVGLLKSGSGKGFKKTATFGAAEPQPGMVKGSVLYAYFFRSRRPVTPARSSQVGHNGAKAPRVRPKACMQPSEEGAKEISKTIFNSDSRQVLAVIGDAKNLRTCKCGNRLGVPFQGTQAR